MSEYIFSNHYKKDIFTKLNFPFREGKKLLDVGCGDASDAKIFIDKFKLKLYGIDIYKDNTVSKINGLNFKKAGIYKIPYQNHMFDYIFLHDVLHHIDEPSQRPTRHIAGLLELKRVCKSGGYIIILEGNRYNPMFYPHMVLHRGHDHFTQKYFTRLISSVFPHSEFKYFEAHLYPDALFKLFKLYERFMESIVPHKYLSYNVAIIKND